MDLQLFRVDLLLDGRDGDFGVSHLFGLFAYRALDLLDRGRILLVLQFVFGLCDCLAALADDLSLNHDSASGISDFTLNLNLLALDCYLSRLDLILYFLFDGNGVLDSFSLLLLGLYDLLHGLHISHCAHLPNRLLKLLDFLFDSLDFCCFGDQLFVDFLDFGFHGLACLIDKIEGFAVDRNDIEVLELIKLLGCKLHAMDLTSVFVLEFFFLFTLELYSLSAEKEFSLLAVAVLADHHVLLAVVVWRVGGHLLAGVLAVDLHGLHAAESWIGAFVATAFNLTSDDHEFHACLGLVKGLILDA